MNIKVFITKEVLKQSMFCGTMMQPATGKSCAFAVAFRDIFPEAWIKSNSVLPFGSGGGNNIIILPFAARDYISRFDSLVKNPIERLNLPEVTFEIYIPDSVIKKIGISQVEKILSESINLERV